MFAHSHIECRLSSGLLVAPEFSANSLPAEQRLTLDSIHLSCPWCGKRFEMFADGSGGDAEYIEDCPACCKAINVRIATDGEGEGELLEWSASDDR